MKTNNREENEIVIFKKWLRNEIRNDSGVSKVILRYKISGDILSLQHPLDGKEL